MEKETWKLPEDWASQKRPISEEARMKRMSFWVGTSMLVPLVAMFVVVILTAHDVASFIFGLGCTVALLTSLVMSVLDYIWSKDDQ